MGIDKIGLPEDRVWAGRIFSTHYGVGHYLRSSYVRTARQYGKYQANRKLAVMGEKLTFATGHTASMDDQSIFDMAGVRAVQAEHIYKTERRDSDIESIFVRLDRYCSDNGVEFPVKFSARDDDMSRARKIVAAAERVSDERWWRRRLRVGMGRQVESVLRDEGFVRRGSSPYVSNWALARWKAGQKRNRRALASLEMVTEDSFGQETAVCLQDCVDSSISNPENRRNELMVRLRGYEEIASSMGLVGVFLTLTCPSKFHASKATGGKNKKFCGATPADCMGYLNGVWAKIRASWARAGIKTFGFRIAEPHHDGTPHFHFMLFFNKDDKDGAMRLFGGYALEVDGDEPGAAKNRYDIVEIDPARGSAAGYIAKYISKNIDGFMVDEDDEGGVFGDDGAMRVRAWASLWGVRQFQQIGSVSVTVWRELRRDIERFEQLIIESQDLDIVDRLRLAADAGNWAEFVNLMGGVFVSRGNQTLRPLYHEGAMVPSRYGEAVKRMIGLYLNPLLRRIHNILSIDSIVFTREKVWRVRARDSVSKAARPPT